MLFRLLSFIYPAMNFWRCWLLSPSVMHTVCMRWGSLACLLAEKSSVLGILLIISGCSIHSSHFNPPVVELNHTKNEGTHIVQRGETLYEIAFKYGYDYRSIAVANHIKPPFIIYPGQQLRLGHSAHPPVNSLIKKSQKSIIKKSPLPVKPVLTPVVLPNQVEKQWMWPAQGKIVKSFISSGMHLNKGINIGGVLGDPIYCAQNGKVVYSGAGLRGYGQLLIVKHDDTYLSAYAHNQRLLVKEGDQVNKGQIIARMGKSDAGYVNLHFEIRKNGQPIDPLKLLPIR